MPLIWLEWRSCSACLMCRQCRLFCGLFPRARARDPPPIRIHHRQPSSVTISRSAAIGKDARQTKPSKIMFSYGPATGKKAMRSANRVHMRLPNDQQSDYPREMRLRPLAIMYPICSANHVNRMLTATERKHTPLANNWRLSIIALTFPIL